MKLMFISDIHGSSLYAQKAIDTYKQEKADKLIILGDILYHGPRNDLPEEYAPKKSYFAIECLQERYYRSSWEL